MAALGATPFDVAVLVRLDARHSYTATNADQRSRYKGYNTVRVTDRSSGLRHTAALECLRCLQRALNFLRVLIYRRVVVCLPALPSSGGRAPLSTRADSVPIERIRSVRYRVDAFPQGRLDPASQSIPL